MLIIVAREFLNVYIAINNSFNFCKIDIDLKMKRDEIRKFKVKFI